MFKCCTLIKPFAPDGDPFRYQGSEAEQAIRTLFPAVKGYVQTRALAGQPSPSFSGVAELWFAKPEEALAAAQVDLNTILSDDAEIHSVVTGMERVVVRTPQYITSDKIKGVYPFARKPGMSLEDFQDHWWHRHGPIAALTEAALSYIQVHGLPESYDQIVPVYDGITEISWTDAEAAGRAIVSRQMTEDQGSDAPNFVDMDSIALFLAQEETIIAP